MTHDNALLPIALYVHWPFCKAKCPYCDFNSHVRERIDQQHWRQALLKELDTMAQRVPGRTLTSIFFGGGTPSLMDPDTVGAIIEQARHYWPSDRTPEITLEANPTSIEAGRFRAYGQSGVNRVSLGIQSLDDAALKFLGRQHSAAEASHAITIAATHFKRFSFDLIYARPTQTVQAWTQELRQAIAYAAGHLSVYQLTIEPGTQFYTQHQRGDFQIPGDDLAGALYECTQDILHTAGLNPYEISNHARSGEESLHNLAYWRYQDYVGIGPGAHGRLTIHNEKYATRTHRAPEVWLERVKSQGHGLTEETLISLPERTTETLMMGLRLAEGVPLSRLSAESGGKSLLEIVSPPHLSALVAEGFIMLTPTHIKATAAGRQRLNALLDRLIR